MFNTVKLCEIRDCNSGKFELCPHDAINPCRVFRALDSARWFHESTGDRVVLVRLADGTFFNAEQWLERQYIQSLQKWTIYTKVHENVRWRPKLKPQRVAKPPRLTAKELDEMASFYIQHRVSHKTMRARIDAIGLDIRSLRRMNRRYGENASIGLEIEKLINEQRVLRQVQSETDRAKTLARDYAIEDRAWEKRWMKTNGKTTTTAYLYTADSRQYEIDANGVLIDREYVHLPELHAQYDECINWAKVNLSIAPEAWVAVKLEDKDPISSPIRKSGKKNTSGRRIRARAAHRQYVADVKDIKKWLLWSKFSIWRFTHDDDMKALYERIKGRILQKTR
jgi:hypothetical protein